MQFQNVQIYNIMRKYEIAFFLCIDCYVAVNHTWQEHGHGVYLMKKVLKMRYVQINIYANLELFASYTYNHFIAYN